LQIFQLILLSNLVPVSFGASNKCYYRNRPALLFTLYNTKNIQHHHHHHHEKNLRRPLRGLSSAVQYMHVHIAYHIMEELIFYADKIIVMGNSKNLRVFNFAIYSNCENRKNL